MQQSPNGRYVQANLDGIFMPEDWEILSPYLSSLCERVIVLLIKIAGQISVGIKFDIGQSLSARSSLAKVRQTYTFFILFVSMH
jgi:hypothetical protein